MTDPSIRVVPTIKHIAEEILDGYWNPNKCDEKPDNPYMAMPDGSRKIHKFVGTSLMVSLCGKWLSYDEPDKEYVDAVAELMSEQPERLCKICISTGSKRGAGKKKVPALGDK